MESVVQRSLHPTITRNETREYQLYCSQFAQVQFRQTERAGEADMHVYESMAALAQGDLSRVGHARLRVDSTMAGGTDAAYSTFVHYTQQPLHFQSYARAAAS